MKFIEIEQKGQFLNPDLKEIEFTLTLRKDPLTQQITVIAPELKQKTEIFTKSTDWSLIKSIFKESEQNCPFCSSNIAKATPKFPNILHLASPLSIGEATAFPNLFPQWQWHSVVVLTKSHFILPNKIHANHFANGIKVALRLFESINREDKKIKYASINWNYLHPAGATLPHPHLQLLAGEMPTNRQQLLLAKSKEYYEKKRKSFWINLIEEERKKKLRFLKSSAGINWIIPFAPLADYELQAIFLTNNLLDLSIDVIKELTINLINILDLYVRIGFSSFNFSLIGNLDNEADEYYSILFFIHPRQNVYANYRNDINFLGGIQHTRFIARKPEENTPFFKQIFFD